jgi:TatD DNase family protein
MPMVELFDTHAHFEGEMGDIGEILDRAFNAGVTHIMAVGGSVGLNDGVQKAKSYNSKNIIGAIGWDRDTALEERAELDFSGMKALGEIGLDYFYTPETRKAQISLFEEQLECAKKNSLPVIIHTREADEDTLAILKNADVRGIIHCFTGSLPFCRKLLDLGYYISYSGIVTFNAAENVRETARYVPNDRILIETDSPFLAPVPMRGKKNEPSNLVYTAKFLAALRSMEFEDFASLTVNNAFAVFNCR